MAPGIMAGWADSGKFGAERRKIAELEEKLEQAELAVFTSEFYRVAGM
jgi:hypothetical protein